MTEHLWKIFCKPFKSRLFKIVFFCIFIPVGTFGIHYSMLDPSFSWTMQGLSDLYTPETLFTYVVPLLVAVVIDGIIVIINSFKNLATDGYEYELLRDSTILGFVVFIIQIVFLYLSLTQNNVFFSILCVAITWILWIMQSASKAEFKPTTQWKPDGNQDDTTMEAVTNG